MGFSYTMPRNGTLTNISGNFTTTATINLGLNTATIQAQLYVAAAGTSTYTPLGFATVNLGAPLTGIVLLGTTLFGTVNLGVPLFIGQQILMVLSVTGSPILTIVAGTFSGGINIV